jgi:hypothetical protein
MKSLLLVIPAKAGIQCLGSAYALGMEEQSHWIPAFAGMTAKRRMFHASYGVLS